jgi:hypothetical protein
LDQRIVKKYFAWNYRVWKKASKHVKIYLNIFSFLLIVLI